MTVSEAIVSRRTIFDFTAEPVPDVALEAALEAGRWAQNHRLTEPWRFRVLGPETHRALAEAFAEVQLRNLKPAEVGLPDDVVRAKVLRKIMSKPRLVVVSTRLSADELQCREDYAAVCCAVQNIQLAAWEAGLGMQWSSNKMTRAPEAYTLLGIDPAAEEMIGFLYFGYPADIPAARPRKPLDEVMFHLP